MQRLFLSLVLCLASCAAPPVARPVVWVEADGKTVSVASTLNEPFEIVAEAGVVLGEADEVWADGVRVEAGSARDAAPVRITVRRAVTISIADSATPGETLIVQTAARTVGEALWQAGLRLTAADIVEPTPESAITPNLTITLIRARPLTIQADGRTLTMAVQPGSVTETLAQVGLALVGADYVLPVENGLRIVRVREEVITEQLTIPRETVYQAMPQVDIDTVQTLQAGADGALRRNIRVRYEDGVEVSRVAEAETLALAAAPRVIGYGTKITVRTVETADGVLEYWRAYTMYATSYSPARAGVPRTARNYGITASGQPLTKGLVAIDRRYISFGTRMYVPGYGFALAADTGGGVKGRFIDLGYDDGNYQSWARVITVYFLTPVPPDNQIVWIIPSTIP
ncbi:MAG: G5 domain-containing protein [Anaerolineales bacterium]